MVDPRHSRQASMSRAPLEDVNTNGADIGPRTGDQQYIPRSAQNQTSQAESSFVDSSGPIFSMYLGMAEEEDKKLAESWKADADGILIFTGLFSAAVASLISVSIQDIRQNPQDTSNFYLANIYQAIADPNRSNISSSLPPTPPSFSPPAYAVWVNSLWFLSLVISITCALLATLLQQWARRYLKVTQTRYSLHKRARIRSFFAEGVEKSLLPLAVEALPTLVHVSLFLFFSGLVLFLWNVNLTAFKAVLSWISVCTALYGCVTLIPIFRPDSPYYTPLTSLAEFVVFLIIFVFWMLCAAFYVLVLSCSSHFCSCGLGPARIIGYLAHWLESVVDMTSVTPKQAALELSSEIDSRALMWTFDCLDEDHELEGFISGLPGFHNSKVVKEPLHSLDNEEKIRLLAATIGLLDRTFSSDLLLDQAKHYRTDICTNAINLVDTPRAFPEILRRLASEDGYGPVHSTEILHFVKRWGNRKGESTTVVEALFSVVVARVQQHDDSWFTLASDELSIPETVLREHAAHGNDLSLAILIYITRQQFVHFPNSSWPLKGLSNTLETASKFNMQDTSPGLQHDFCALWNQAVRKAQNDDNTDIADYILRPTRKVYITLHQGTNSAPSRFSASTSDQDEILWDPDSYPLCNVPGHHPDSTPHIHGDCTLTSLGSAIPPDDAKTALVPSFLPISLDMPSSSSPTAHRVDENPMEVPPLGNEISVTLSLQPVDQTITESCRIPSTSPDSGSTRPTHGNVDTSKATRLFTPDPSASYLPRPKSPTHPPGAIAVQQIAPSVDPDIPLLPFPTPLLDHTLLTESHPSMPTPVTPFASLSQSTSAPDIRGAVEDESNLKAGSHQDKDALDSSISRENITAIPDLSPQSLSPPPIADIVIAAPLRGSVDSEHTGDHPPQPLHGQYDIV